MASVKHCMERNQVTRQKLSGERQRWGCWESAWSLVFWHPEYKTTIPYLAQHCDSLISASRNNVIPDSSATPSQLSASSLEVTVPDWASRAQGFHLGYLSLCLMSSEMKLFTPSAFPFPNWTMGIAVFACVGRKVMGKIMSRIVRLWSIYSDKNHVSTRG